MVGYLLLRSSDLWPLPSIRDGRGHNNEMRPQFPVAANED